MSMTMKTPDMAPEALPENYPHQFTKDVDILGYPVRFRPIHPGDNHRMLMLFDTFSMETIYHRFFSYVRMPPERVKRFTMIDYGRQMAIVAEEEKDGQPRLMGVARYAMPKEAVDDAEMAIVIGDPWQGRGLGTTLLRYLIDLAEIRGLTMMYGLVHFDNRAVPRVVRKLGVKYKKKDNGTEWRYEVFPGQLPEEPDKKPAK